MVLALKVTPNMGSEICMNSCCIVGVDLFVYIFEQHRVPDDKNGTDPGNNEKSKEAIGAPLDGK